MSGLRQFDVTRDKRLLRDRERHVTSRLAESQDERNAQLEAKVLSHSIAREA